MEFNEQQKLALESDARNLLVLAGAGTGKTRTIIGRARFLLESGVRPEKIAIITFTRRSASEIRARLSQESAIGRTSDAKSPSTNVVTGTFHYFCLREMRARPAWFGFDSLTIIDRDDQLQLMKLARGKIVGQQARIPQAAELVNFYSYARNTNQPVRNYLTKHTEVEGDNLDTVEKIFEAYKLRKREGGYFDYDDILHRFAKVLHDNEDIRRKIAGRYAHVLVDEMQDTNPLQWLILESLAEQAQLFCVGDDAQSIYAFRGADFKNVHSFEERLPNASTMKLELNYRSTQEILDLSNWLLGESRLKYGKHLTAHRGSGVKPKLIDFDSDFEEADWIVESIMQRQSQGSPWHENMILCRTAYTARPIEAKLIENKIPYRFIGGIGLLQMAHVRDLLSAVRVVCNHRDELAWMRYLMLFPRIGEVTAARILEELQAANDSTGAIELLQSKVANRKEIYRPLQMLLSKQNQPSEALKQLGQDLEETLSNKYDNWESRSRDFKLIEQLAEQHSGLAEFLETYTLDPINSTEFQPRGDSTDIVTLITVHSAKGTEAKYCYVAAVAPGNYPHKRSLGDEDAIEEERRILYVAFTRAQDELIVTRNLSRGFNSWNRSSWNSSAGSEYFLEKLPSKLVEAHGSFSRTYPRYDADYFDNDVI